MVEFLTGLFIGSAFVFALAVNSEVQRRQRRGALLSHYAHKLGVDISTAPVYPLECCEDPNTDCDTGDCQGGDFSMSGTD